MTFLYFAYGSNMLPARLRARCPSARVVGCATARGFDLAFTKRSKDGSGKATLVMAADMATPGVLFEIADAELKELDRAEGAGFGYDRVSGFAVHAQGVDAPVPATTYIGTGTDLLLKPYDWYLALVVAGARHHALGCDHIARLQHTEYLVDDDHGRAARSEALEALRANGYDDYGRLLKPAG